MVVDRLARGVLRAILGLMPGSIRRAYADEILALNSRRRAEVRGVVPVTRLWIGELAAALRATWTAWTDPSSPQQPPRRRKPVPMGRRAMAMGGITQDLRFALRELRRGEITTLLVVVTLAIGIGAVLTVFSLVDGLLLNPIPVPEAERVVRVFEALNADAPFGGTSYPMLADYRRSTLIEGPAGWTSLEAGFRAGELSDRVSVGLVSGDFFDVLRVQASVGRVLQPDDDEPGAPLVALLSDELWARVFQRDAGVVGAPVEISGTPFTVVGVLPADFKGASLEEAPDLWAPLATIRTVAASGLYAAPNVLETRAFAWLSLVGRLRPGVRPGEAEAELETIARAVRAEHADDDDEPEAWQIAHVRTLAEAAIPRQRDDAIDFVAVLGGIVTLTLTIACLNASLLISTRAWGRDLELSVRQAIGAPRARLVRQLIAENLLLALAGAASGIGLALIGGRALQAFSLPGGTSLARLDMTLDARMVGAALLLAVLSTAVFGVWPALAQGRRDVGDRLRAAGRGVIADVAGLPAMIAAQTGLSLVLLVGALLFARTLMAALSTPLGFDPNGVAALSFAFQGHGYSNEEVPPAARSILDAVEASPAVSSAALAAHVPLSPSSARLRPIPEGAPEDWQATAIAINAVSDGYFRTLRIPLVTGRTFGRDDGPDAPDVAVLNRAAAATLFPSADPVGERFVLVRGLDPVEVIGVVEDHKVHAVTDEAVPYVYLSAAQNAGVGIATGAHLVARASGPPAAALDAMRSAVRTFDASLPTYDARLIASQMNRVLMPQRFGALLLGLLAAVTLAVSAIGVYAMVSFGVRRRTREIGIRIALGAEPLRVMLEAVRRAGYALLAGVAVGAALAAGLVRFVAAYLYGVEPLDLAAFGSGALVLLGVSMVAALRPARRAARIDPDLALRQER